MTNQAPHSAAQLARSTRSQLARTVNFNRRHTWIVGLTAWAAAAVALAVHSTGVALPDPLRFAMLESWLLATGRLVPVRSCGRGLNPVFCRTVALVCFALAVLLTLLIVGGSMRVNTLDGTFEMLLPMGIGLQMHKAGCAERYGEWRQAVGYQAAYSEIQDAAVAAPVADELALHRAALAHMDDLKAMSLAELEALSEIVGASIEFKRRGHLSLLEGGQERARRR